MKQWWQLCVIILKNLSKAVCKVVNGFRLPVCALNNTVICFVAFNSGPIN